MTYRPTAGELPDRAAIPASYMWDLSHICQSWDEWQESYEKLDAEIEAFKSRQGTLAGGPDARVGAFQAMDRMGVSAIGSGTTRRCATTKISGTTRSTRAGSRSRFSSPASISPAPGSTRNSWPSRSRRSASGWTSRGTRALPLCDRALFHEQEHVLDEQGERLLSYASRSSSVSHDSYSALTTADMKPPTIVLGGGDRVALSYGQYRAILETNRNPYDRATVYRASIRSTPTIETPTRLCTTACYSETGFTLGRANESTLEAALHGNNIPTSVVETLIRSPKKASRLSSVSPASSSCAWRRRIGFRRLDPAGRARCALYLRRGGSLDRRVSCRAGREYQQDVRDAFGRRWIDVFENTGKRSGATRRPCTERTRTCCSISTRRSTRSSRWRTRWVTRCTRCSRIGPSPSYMPATRSSSRRCHRR